MVDINALFNELGFALPSGDALSAAIEEESMALMSIDDIALADNNIPMPALDELPAPEKINYRYADFFGESYVLVVTYDENTYKSEKAKLEQSYTFLNRALVDPYNDGKYTIPEYKFAYGGYDFHVVETEGSCYPKYFGLVGSSDSSFSIAYVYFCDLDLDYIESMDRFMKNEIDYDW